MDINKLVDVIDKDNNMYQWKTKAKPIDIKLTTYINFDVENNDGSPKFIINHQLRISKNKTIFAKDYTPNYSEEFLAIEKVKNTVPGALAIEDLNGKEIVRTFYEEKFGN